MSAALSWYEPGTSWLHRLDPRPKLALVVLGTVALASVLSIPVLALFLIVAQGALVSAGISWPRLASIWRILLPLLLTIALVQPLLSPAGTPWLVWGPIRLTPLGVALGIALALRLAAIGFCWYTLLLTTRERDLVQALVQVGLPFTWGLVLAMALRYPSTLQGRYQLALEAQQARGLRLEGRGLLGRARAQLPVLIAMMVATLRLIDQLAMALEARGFGGPAKRTSLRTLHMRAADWLALGVVVAAAGALLTARVVLGFGAGPLDGWPRG